MQAQMPQIPSRRCGAEPRTVFRGLGEYRRLIEKLEDVEEAPVVVDGESVNRFKALVFAQTRRVVAVVSRRFHLVLHRHALGEVASVLASRGMDPSGYVTEGPTGQLYTKMHFPNPRFLLDLRLGSRDEENLMYLGLAVENGYADPNCAIHVEAMGLNPNRGHHVLLGRILGQAKIPHVGDVQKAFTKALGRLALDAQHLADCIQDADAALFTDRSQALLALRGAGFGPRVANAILNGNKRHAPLRDPVSAWTLFDAVGRFVASSPIGEQARNEHLRRAQAFLQADEVFGLVESGRRVVEDEKATCEAAAIVAPAELAAVA